MVQYSEIDFFSEKSNFALAMAMLLTFLGIIGNFGSYIYSMKETFIPHTRLGFADVVFQCNVVFNPILYLYYWLQEYGRLILISHSCINLSTHIGFLMLQVVDQTWKLTVNGVLRGMEGRSGKKI